MYHFLQTIFARPAPRGLWATFFTILLIAIAGTADAQTGKQGRLIIETATQPAFDRSMTVFGFRLSGPRLSTPMFFENGSKDQWVSAPLDAGRYLLEQRSLPAAWQFSDIDCGVKQVWSGVVAIDAGETVRCTVTNTRAGRVIVQSRTQPENSTADFDFSLVDADGVTQTVTVEPDGSAVIPVHEGTYTLRESRRGGWATEVTCQSGDGITMMRRVIVAPGETVVCTAVNTYVELAEPGITINVSPDEQAAVAGTSATFTVTVRNTGNIDLSNIDITSTNVPQCSRTIERIHAAASPTVYTCSVNNLQGGITNRLSATSTEGASAFATASVYLVDRLNPVVRVLVEANRNSVESGSAVRFTVTVINAGNTPLTNVRLNAPQAPACERTVGKIPVGNRTRFQCTRWSTSVSFNNRITATTDQGASGSGSARVEVVSGKAK